MSESIAQAVEMIPSPVMFVAGVILLLLGGNWLVEGAVRIARRMDIPPLIVGLTIVAFGTSAPELAFNVIAALAGNASLSFGNVIGSNIANIGLVLGLTAVIRAVPVTQRVARVELPLLGAVTVFAALLALIPMAHAALPGEDELRLGYGRIEGPMLLLCFAIFCTFWIRAALRGSPPEAISADVPTSDAPKPGAVAAAVMAIGGLLILLAGGKLTEIGAIGVASAAGLSPGFIGLSIVAVATSLPEIVTSVIAARRGQPELAIGNVIGSNLFNLLLVMGATSLIVPVPVPPMGLWDLSVMVFATALLIPMARRRKGAPPHRRFSRVHGALLLGMYITYMTARLLLDPSAG